MQRDHVVVDAKKARIVVIVEEETWVVKVCGSGISRVRAGWAATMLGDAELQLYLGATCPRR